MESTSVTNKIETAGEVSNVLGNVSKIPPDQSVSQFPGV